MTTLREAAQQALRAAEQGATVSSICILRAALAEHYCDTHCTWADHAQGCVRAEPVQEPVAWLYEARHIDTAWRAAVSLNHPGEGVYMRKVTPLYPAPPQRKPLTKTEILLACAPLGFAQLSPFEVAGAIERAHGIGVEP